MSQREVKRKRKNKKRQRKKFILAFFVILAVALLCGLSLTVFFPVKDIQVYGSSYYNADTIISASSVNVDDNILVLSKNKILNNIQKELPFVDDIELKRKLPGTVIINVTDAKELYCYKVNEIYYSADEKGRILKEYTKQPTELTFIECEASVSDSLVKEIKFENNSVQEIIEQINDELASCDLKADYIDLTNLYEIRMEFDSRFTVELGEAIYLKEKLALLNKMIETKDTEESGIFKLDMWSPENPKGSYFKNDL